MEKTTLSMNKQKLGIKKAVYFLKTVLKYLNILTLNFDEQFVFTLSKMTLNVQVLRKFCDIILIMETI